MSQIEILRAMDYLGHIVEAIDRIHRYAQDLTERGFLEDEKTQDAVVRNFEVLGEASRNIEKHHAAFAQAHAEVPWALLYTMRNRVAHRYFKVDYELVWKTIHADLPALRAQVAALISAQAPTLAQSPLAELMQNPIQIADFTPLNRDDTNKR